MILNKKCNHSSAIARNCKYCPDCGKKIVHKWVTIQCNLCGHYRKPETSLLGRIKPVKKYCFNCGATDWSYQYYYESTIPDKMKEISLKQAHTQQEHDNRFLSSDRKTRIWISRP